MAGWQKHQGYFELEEQEIAAFGMLGLGTVLNQSKGDGLYQIQGFGNVQIRYVDNQLLVWRQECYLKTLKYWKLSGKIVD